MRSKAEWAIDSEPIRARGIRRSAHEFVPNYGRKVQKVHFRLTTSLLKLPCFWLELCCSHYLVPLRHSVSRAFVFACLIFAYSRNTPHESRMNRVRALLSMRGMLPGYSLEPRRKGGVLATACSVMNISLSINGCSRSKKEILSLSLSLSLSRERERENKIDLYRSSGLRQLQRFYAIQAETPFLLLTHEEDRRRLCTQDAFIHIQNSLVDNEEEAVYQTNFICKH